MRKLLSLICILAAFLQINAQNTTVDRRASIATLKTYTGTSAYVWVSDSLRIYATCPGCTADEITVFAGAAGRKWTAPARVTLSQLLTAPTEGPILFNKDFVGVGPFTHNWMKFRPLVKADEDVNGSYYMGQSATQNNGVMNEVWAQGWNLGPGGGPVEAGKPSIGEMEEQDYEIGPGGFGARLLEKHDVVNWSDGSGQTRLASFTVNNDLKTINYYLTTDLFDIRKKGGFPYFIAQGVANNSTARLANELVEGENFSMDANFLENSTTASFTITQSSGKANNTFALGGFNLAKLPATVNLTPSSGNATLINFLNGSSVVTAQLGNTGTNTLLNSISGTLQWAASNLLGAELRSNVFNVYRDLTVGPHTAAVARLDVRNADYGVTSYFENTFGSGAKYSAIFTTVNGGTNNNALFSASGGTSNRGIGVDVPAGTNNLAVNTGLNTARSWFGGPIVVGASDNTSPSANIQLPNTANTQADGIAFGDALLWRQTTGTLRVTDEIYMNGLALTSANNKGVYYAANFDYGNMTIKTTTGGVFTRNINDAITAWTVDQKLGTGKLVEYKFNGAVKASIDKDGIFTHTSAAIGATSTAGAIYQNTTAAGSGAQQWSPALRFIGQGWKTAATAGSQPVEFRFETVPVQGNTNPLAEFRLTPYINGVAQSPIKWNGNGDYKGIRVNEGQTGGSIYIDYAYGKGIGLPGGSGASQGRIAWTTFGDNFQNSSAFIVGTPDGTGIGIGVVPVNGTTAIVDITSTTKGLLPPRMTTTQRNAISSPATWLMLVCTDCTATDGSTGVLQIYNGSVWKNAY